MLLDDLERGSLGWTTAFDPIAALVLPAVVGRHAERDAKA